MEYTYTFDDDCVNELSLIFNDLNLVKLLKQYYNKCVLIKTNENKRVIINPCDIKILELKCQNGLHGYYFYEWCNNYFLIEVLHSRIFRFLLLKCNKYTPADKLINGRMDLYQLEPPYHDLLLKRMNL